MKRTEITQTVDTGYKAGFVKCSCGYQKDLGDGFNQYHIDHCPECTPELETRSQRKVMYGSKNSYTVDIGKPVYFVLSNGINVRYSFTGQTYRGLSERQADNM